MNARGRRAKRSSLADYRARRDVVTHHWDEYERLFEEHFYAVTDEEIEGTRREDER